MFWIIFTTIILIFTFLGKNQDNLTRGKRYFLAITISRILLAISLSYVVAHSAHNFADNDEYINFYENLRSSEIEKHALSLNIFEERTSQFEIGFHLLSLVVSNLKFSNIGYLFIISLITNILLIDFFYKFKYPIFIIIVFITSGIYFQECNLVRQMLAIAIFCYSLKYLNNNILKYVACIICASLIHISAIFLLVLLILSLPNINNRYTLIDTIVFILWCISILVAVGIIDINISRLNFISYYQNYITTDNSVGAGNLHNYAIIYNIHIALYYLFTDKFKIKDDYIYVFIFIFGGILTNCSLLIPNLYRFSLYFTIMQIVIIPTVLMSNVKDKCFSISKITFGLFYLYYVARILVNIISNDNPIQ